MIRIAPFDCLGIVDIAPDVQESRDILKSVCIDSQALADNPRLILKTGDCRIPMSNRYSSNLLPIDWILALLAAALLSMTPACGPAHNPIALWLPSPNFNARLPQMVIIHHTSENSFETALHLLQTRNAGGRVSSHYLIAKDGRLVQLVSEEHRAWHAGTGTWGPYQDLNSVSIGIELDNNGTEPFPKAQMDALLHLLKDITLRYHIPRALVVGHADVEPVRKTDPNGHFPWKLLSEHGFGLWPDSNLVEPPPGFNPWQAIQRIGYGTKDPAATLRAFHRHYRPGAGDALDEQDCRIIFNLEQKVFEYTAVK